MWTWIAQNKEWVFSGIGVAFLSVLWLLLRRIFSGPPTTNNTVTQSPSIVVSPTINVPGNFPNHSSYVAPLRSAEQIEAERPTLYTLPPRICFIRENEGREFTEGGGAQSLTIRESCLRDPLPTA
jgi:hypothetical protein